jgi:hypothetical protein
MDTPSYAIMRKSVFKNGEPLVSCIYVCNPGKDKKSSIQKLRELADNNIHSGEVYHGEEGSIVLATKNQPNLVYDHYYISVTVIDTD